MRGVRHMLSRSRYRQVGFLHLIFFHAICECWGFLFMEKQCFYFPFISVIAFFKSRVVLYGFYLFCIHCACKFLHENVSKSTSNFECSKLVQVSLEK
ncbi:Os03g0337200 [Oryza sativa Japonica Group]|uniref:Os03g0337200 protein n=3 Tax=Oryza TaxID=4527 RepID=A0A0P0VX72_ORYSJ|nr:hypothetical protein EE612_017271 [Oryza sativa]BAF11961.1 Os03g0337200 [Oryza sativa Japonica Group]BAS84092.1 Os03g0337200 [Oryza sativa Japonica Group]|eukprot:NP_001050047.1 Os03g0337200 [Oryza sativa Japonica Group]